MAGGSPIAIGPVVGGLNSFSDPTAVADNELVKCENFELDLDGSLVSRPPIADNGITFPLGATGNFSILGYYYAQGGVAYLIGSDGLNSTYYFTGSAWTILTNTIAASAVAQFNDFAWLMAPVGSGNPGGYWSPAGGFVADANMPKGEIIVANKSRLWVSSGRDATVNGTRLYFSKVLGTVPFWPAVTDFLDIGAGDGQNIVQIVVYFNSLLLFRTNSVYSFQFSSDPASGSVSLIIPGVGLADKDAIAAYEGYLYFMYKDRAYEFYNNRATQINIKAPLVAISRANQYKSYSVSVFGNRAIFSFFDTMFVFSLKTRTWTTWFSTLRGPIGRIVPLASSGQFLTAILHSSTVVPAGGTRVAKTLFLTDGLTADVEAMNCIAVTKNYNYEATSAYKRMFWWGVDATFRSQVTAVATPIVYNYAVTWAVLRTVTWATLKNYTWGQPITGTLSVQTVRDTAGSFSIRKFVKFSKSIWFRQVNFRVNFTTDGSQNTAPVRLFSLMTYVTSKQRVSKTIS